MFELETRHRGGVPPNMSLTEPRTIRRTHALPRAVMGDEAMGLASACWAGSHQRSNHQPVDTPYLLSSSR